MIRVDLIPRQRIERRHRRRRLQVWLAIVAAYAACVLAGALGIRIADSRDDRKLRQALTLRRETTTSAIRAVQEMGTLVTNASIRLAANRAVGDQPDWSVLLAILAETAGEDVVLLRCSMSIAGQGPGRPAVRPPAGTDGGTAADRARTVELTGLAPTQHDVSGFLLRMERTPLFRDVRLLDTRRQPLLDRTVVLFRVDLRLDAGREGAL